MHCVVQVWMTPVIAREFIACVFCRSVAAIFRKFCTWNEITFFQKKKIHMQQSNSSCLNCNPMKSIYDIYRSTYLNMITILIYKFYSNSILKQQDIPKMWRNFSRKYTNIFVRCKSTNRSNNVLKRFDFGIELPNLTSITVHFPDHNPEKRNKGE